MASDSSNSTCITSVSFFSSISSENRWVDQMSKNFEKELKIDIDRSPCVFHVPKSLSAEKPEAYTPKRMGLGPYHHFRLELYEMEREKLAAVKKDLTPDQIVNFQQLVIDKLKDLEPTFRACYDQYLDLDGNTLAWILAIDGLFLHHHLRTCYNYYIVDSTDTKLAQDIFMMENQIPLILLEEIQKALELPKIIGLDSSDAYSSDADSSDAEFSMIMSVSNEADVIYAFCKACSPLELIDERLCPLKNKHAHLLDYLYHLIVTPRPKIERRIMLKCNDMVENAGKIVDTMDSLGIGGPHVQAAQRLIKFIQKLPWDKIGSLLPKSDGNETTSEEITIPSVSNLQKIAGVKFALMPKGIRYIEFKEATLTFHLPVITLNADSEVILRNLVAYEALAMSGSTLVLAEYIDLMCGIIDTVEDVRLLREERIIKGDLPDNKIADLFNGMKKTTGMDKASDLERAIDEVNKHYENRPRVKAYRGITNCLRSSWTCVQASWKVLSFLSTIVLVLFLSLKAFCEVYGCSLHWFGNSKVLNLGFADVSSLVM